MAAKRKLADPVKQDKEEPQPCLAAAAAHSSRRQARQQLPRLSSKKQKRLDVLMNKNNRGQLTKVERLELQGLVRETEEIALENARRMAGRS